MRKLLCLAVLLPIFAAGAGKADFLRVQTVMNTGENNSSEIWSIARPPRASSGHFGYGEVDTVGGTTYDWLCTGPALRMIYYDSLYGVHVVWMFSADPGPNFPDRNMRYNFLDNATGTWLFSQGASFLDFGVNGFTARTGFGTLDVNPVTGCAYISAHAGNIYPTVVKDASPGSGTFEECASTEPYAWPVMAFTTTEKVHVADVEYATKKELYYARVDPWGAWTTHEALGLPGAQPNFPDQAITGTRSTSTMLTAAWVDNDAAPSPCYWRSSADDGTTWSDTTELGLPETFTPGSESVPTHHIAGVFPYYDSYENLHFVTNIGPIVGGTAYIIPTEIWHCSPGAVPEWSLITRATCDTLNLQGSVGYNALYASRPMLGEDDAGDLYCIWEQFDSMNVEPTTTFMRADIYGAVSTDGGATWGAPLRITDPDETSKRFPCISPRAKGDTLFIRYEIDLIAGFSNYQQGATTDNPIVVLKIWGGLFPRAGAVAEGAAKRPSRLEIGASPNPVRSRTTFTYQLPRAAQVKLAVYDASGRLVSQLASGHRAAGAYRAEWNTGGLPAGAYFYTLTVDRKKLTRKLTLLN
jgi:hypothetical protein